MIRVTCRREIMFANEHTHYTPTLHPVTLEFVSQLKSNHIRVIIFVPYTMNIDFRLPFLILSGICIFLCIFGFWFLTKNTTDDDDNNNSNNNNNNNITNNNS